MEGGRRAQAMSFFSSRTARSQAGRVVAPADAGVAAETPARRILVANGKGGCGKTTIATNLAAYYAGSGYRVALMDHDPQGSSVHWGNLRRQAGHAELYAASAIPRPGARVTRSFQQRIPQGTQRIVLDAPAGVHGPQLVDMLADVDVILIPVLPSAIDIHAASRFIGELLLAGRVRSRSIRLGVIANRVRENSPVYRSLERFLDTLQIPFVTRFRQTENYAVAAEQGGGIHELDKSRHTTRDRRQWQRLINWLEREEGLRES